MLNSKAIGLKIISARKKMNLSQAELAQQVSISAQAVGKWERGESMPDILTLIRLSEILRVDLNYFSDDVSAAETEPSVINQSVTTELGVPAAKPKERINWDMSEGNWENLDFSGLKNLQEKFSSANLKNCKLIGSELRGLQFKSNNFEYCDFTDSDLSNSSIQRSNFSNCSLENCSFKNTDLSVSFISACNMSKADLSDMSFKSGGIEKCNVSDLVLKRTAFVAIRFSNLEFNGSIEDCSFDKCSFSKVVFRDVHFKNTFFKYSELKRIEFKNCRADRMSYELLRHGKADLSGILLEN
jgi:uncharacterized protein YjbI with pentapeptide repeats